MISFELTEEQQRFKELAHEFAEKEMRPVAERYDETEEFPWPVIKKAADLGLITYMLPEEYGGAGETSAITDCVVQEELFWGCAGIATGIGAVMLGASPVYFFGNDEQKKKWLNFITQPKADGNPRLAGFCLTEPDAGSDAAALKTTAKKVDGGYILNGTKQFITNGGISDLYTVYATVDPAKKVDGITAFIVDGASKGVSGGKKERKMGIRASHTAQVIFEDVFVPDENRLGEEGDGLSIALGTLDHTRAVTAAGAVGVARAAFETALEYSTQRKQFGREIGKFQAISFMLSDMATEIEAARMLCWRAAWMVDQGELSPKESAMAKQYAADMCMKVTTDAVQILGGVGYTRDYPAEKFMRDAKIMQIYEGTSQIQRIVISRFMIGFG